MKMKRLLTIGFALGLFSIATSCEQEQTFTVKFVDYNNEVLLTLNLSEGQMPEFNLEEPTREATAQYSYTFVGWDKQIEAATEDLTYVATYLETINTYEVTFKNADGTVLETKTLEYGQVPTYSGKEPTKEATAEHSYRFEGWDKEFAEVTGDVAYTAQYTELTNAYEVSFVDSNGKLLYKNMFEYGEVPEYKGEELSLEGNVQYSYPFAGWDKELTPVTEKTTYTATYEQVVNKYKVDFVDDKGNVLQSGEVEYGKVPEFTGTLPTLPENNDQYVYSGTWDKEVVSVTGETTYSYVVTQKVKTYTVKFLNEDGSTLFTEEYEYGQTPVYGGQTPTKAKTAKYSYEFKGWNKALAEVTGDVEYTAEYNSTINKYTINFVDEAGNVLQTGEVEYGVVPSFTGTLPTKANTVQYTYSGAWDKVIGEVVDDATYTYVFNPTTNKYDVTINHLNLDGTVAAPAHTANLEYNILTSYKGYYTYEAPAVEGKVANTDTVYYTVDGVNLTINIYYSEVDVWDKTTVSTSLSGTGTQADPYLITSGADLAYVRDQVVAGNYFSGKYLKLTKSIDLGNSAFTIGTSNTVAFGGKLDGNNCSIRGLQLSKTTAQTALFFATLANSEIKNLSLYGSVSGAGLTSGFVGRNYGTISNCTNYATITHSGNSGSGFAGQNEGTIINCTNYGSVTGSGTRGAGIAGTLNAGKIENCINYGSITGTTTASGTAGIVGFGTATATNITGCRNFGTVTGKDYTTGSGNATGGICGEISTPIFMDNINYGSVSTHHTANTKGYMGGCIGRINKSVTTIKDCYNFGSLYSAKNYIGGIVGMSYQGNATISNCHNYGRVETNYSQAGGIVGRNENAAANLKVTDCNNYGEVIGKTHAGAIAGAMASGAATITNCDNYGTYSAPTKSHIVGQYTAFTASGCDDYSAD